MNAVETKATNEIRFILEGCRNGTLKHVQEVFHCKTSHCIAGWNSVLKGRVSRTTGKVLKKGRDFLKTLKFENAFFEFADWETSKSDWDLTSSEATILFDDEATFQQQFSLLETLEAGYRIESYLPSDVFRLYNSIDVILSELQLHINREITDKESWAYFLKRFEAYEYPVACDLINEIVNKKVTEEILETVTCQLETV